MINITHKSNSLRKAIAKATVSVSQLETIQAVKNLTVPKGNVLESARIAALFAAKQTSNIIPDCHPLPIEFTEIRFSIEESSIQIEAEIHTIYKTGVEVEAMHAASVAALTIYDMLKPIDKKIKIESIELMSKTGGKSSKKYPHPNNLKLGIIVSSDSVSSGKKDDKAGSIIQKKLIDFGVETKEFVVVPDEPNLLTQQVSKWVEDSFNLIIITGGTGVSPRDTTPETILPLIEKRMTGIEEAIRNYGQQRTPYAMLSRSVVGFKNKTLIMALPGSSNGAAESIDAVFPSVLHIFDVLNAFNHD